MTTLEEFTTTECMTTLGESRNTLGECRTAMGECMNTLGGCRTDQFISLLILYQGVFCHDQVSSGKFLEFSICDAIYRCC